VPWFRIDDNLAFHHKVVAAGNPAIGLWTRAGALCAQQLTDGFVPDHMIPAMGTKAQAEKLVTVGLWDRVKGGYRFHGWEERQPSKAEVEAERAAAKERMREYRAKKKGTAPKESPQVSDSRSPEQTPNEQRTSGEVREVFGNPDPSLPNPSHPDPPIKTGARTRATRRPEDFRPSDKHVALAVELGVDLKREWPQFCDHHDSRGSTFVDWGKALNTWIRNAPKFGGNVRPLRPEPQHDGQGRLILPPLPGNEWSGR
jgi:hypothetical protein